MGSTFHLAVLNVARMREPLAHPSMKGFTSRIDEINALAEAAPGFVWRWTDEDSGPFARPNILFNLSVWESIEAIKDYTYQSAHAELFRDRERWFKPMPGPSLALWWLPAGQLPTPDQAKERLDDLAWQGPTGYAFTFKQTFPPPAASS